MKRGIPGPGRGAPPPIRAQAPVAPMPMIQPISPVRGTAPKPALPPRGRGGQPVPTSIQPGLTPITPVVPVPQPSHRQVKTDTDLPEIKPNPPPRGRGGPPPVPVRGRGGINPITPISPVPQPINIDSSNQFTVSRGRGAPGPSPVVLQRGRGMVPLPSQSIHLQPTHISGSPQPISPIKTNVPVPQPVKSPPQPILQTQRGRGALPSLPPRGRGGIQTSIHP